MTLRLARLALDNWQSIDGFAASRNMPALASMTQDRFDNFIWWWATRNSGEENELAQFKADLWRPPPGEAVTHPESPWAPENETAALADLKAQLGA